MTTLTTEAMVPNVDTARSSSINLTNNRQEKVKEKAPRIIAVLIFGRIGPMNR